MMFGAYCLQMMMKLCLWICLYWVNNYLCRHRLPDKLFSYSCFYICYVVCIGLECLFSSPKPKMLKVNYYDWPVLRAAIMTVVCRSSWTTGFNSAHSKEPFFAQSFYETCPEGWLWIWVILGHKTRSYYRKCLWTYTDHVNCPNIMKQRIKLIDDGLHNIFKKFCFLLSLVLL